MKRAWMCDNDSVDICIIRHCADCVGRPVVIRTAREDRARSAVIREARTYRSFPNGSWLTLTLTTLDRIRKERK